MPFKTNEQRRASYRRRKEKVLSSIRAHRKTNPDSYRRTQYKRRYGITLEQFNAMVVAQNHRCAICQEEFQETKIKLRIHVDHCHDTMKIRGLFVPAV